MTTLYTPLLKFQQALWDGWICLFRANLEMCEHAGQLQTRLFREHPYFRMVDMIADGADWMDRYGRRNHDVDVEKV